MNPMSTIKSADCFNVEAVYEQFTESAPTQVLVPFSLCWFEDIWLGLALRRSGGQVVDAPMIDQCFALFYSSAPTYYVMPTCLEHEIFDRYGNVTPTIFDKHACLESHMFSERMPVWSRTCSVNLVPGPSK